MTSPGPAYSTHLGKGDLVLVWEPLTPIHAYEDPLPGSNPEMRRGFTVMYIVGQISTPISTLNDIVSVIQHTGICLETEVRGQEHEFANIVSQLLDLGAVITPTWRYAPIEEQYGIDLHLFQPRIDGDTLRFLSRHFSLADLDAPLNDISLNLKTLKYERQNVAPQRKA